MVFQGEIGGSRARRKAIVFHKKISNDCLVLRIFRLRLNIIKVVFGKTARAALAVAKFLQIEDGDELGQLWSFAMRGSEAKYFLKAAGPSTKASLSKWLSYEVLLK